MNLVGVVIMKFAHTIARVLEGIEIWPGRGATFGAGVTAPFVASPPAVGSRAPTLLSRGSRDYRVETAHRASAAFTMSAAVMWLPTPTVSRMDGGRRTRNTKMLF